MVSQKMAQCETRGASPPPPDIPREQSEKNAKSEKRGTSAAQLQILAKEIEADDARIAALDVSEEQRKKVRRIGATAILRKYPNVGFNLDGTRDAMERFRKRRTFARTQGSGRRRSVKTAEAVSKAQEILEQNPKASCGDIVKDAQIKRLRGAPPGTF